MIKTYQNIINNNISKFINNYSNSFKEMLEYGLDGGKRLRPMIMIDIFLHKNNNRYSNELSKDIIGISNIIEFLHSASLIIDDFPCMDNDLFRRDKLSFHNKYGIKMSNILINFFMSQSFLFFHENIVNNQIKNKLLEILDKYITEISVGQYLDLNDKQEKDFNIVDIINLKTYPLFSISFIFGYVLSTGNLSNINLLEDISKHFSMIFQLCDDFEDYQQDSKKKTIMNYVIYLGRENAYNLFVDNKNNFIDKISSLGLYTQLFKDLIEYLEIKIKKYL